jgi:hypothetical protein
MADLRKAALRSELNDVGLSPSSRSFDCFGSAAKASPPNLTVAREADSGSQFFFVARNQVDLSTLSVLMKIDETLPDLNWERGFRSVGRRLNRLVLESLGFLASNGSSSINEVLDDFLNKCTGSQRRFRHKPREPFTAKAIIFSFILFDI